MKKFKSNLNAGILKKSGKYKAIIFQHEKLKKIYKVNQKSTEAEIIKATNTVKKYKSKKSTIFNIIILIVNIAVIAYIFINSGIQNNITSFPDLLSTKINYWFFGATILCFIAIMLVSIYKVYSLIYVSTKKKRFKVSYKAMIMARYYDCITPLSIGGEPYQIYYLTKNNVRSEIATSIPLVSHIIWQIVFVVCNILLLIYNAVFQISTIPLIITLACISITVNALLVFIIIWLSFSKKFAPKIILSILKLLNKMRLIKNYQATFRKVLRFVRNYQRAIKYFASNIKTIILQIFLAIAGFVLNSLLVYFIYLTFNSFATMSFLDILLLNNICELVTLIVPIPGGTIAAEFSFEALYASLFTNGVLAWALLLWRTLTFYIYIIQGFVIIIYDEIIGNKKALKIKKLNLPDTSILSESFKLSHKQNRKLKKLEKFKALNHEETNLIKSEYEMNNPKNIDDKVTLKNNDKNNNKKE